ncbi:MAG: exo-alpha-sialidase [Acidobacteriaceae bacterium]|nr:exo-alpha-sialidase [Acidobacteriaceae bacterium]
MQLSFLFALITVIPQAQPSSPNRQPQMAAVPGLTAVVFGSGNSIWISVSHDAARTFSLPSEIAQFPALALGRHRGPRVAISGKTILVTAICGNRVATGPHAHGTPAEGDLVAWRSTDEGVHWSKPVMINDVAGSAREGLHSMIVGQTGEFAAVWLDLRSSRTQLYGAYSEDGVRWSKNELLYQSPDGTICQCCAPSIAPSDNDQFIVMFRNCLGGARDMYSIRWGPGTPTGTPEKLGVGSWQIAACPMDGGGIAHYAHTTATAWRRDHSVYVDVPGQPEKAVGEGTDVALALAPTGPYVAWKGNSGIEVKTPDRQIPFQLSFTGSFPALTALPGGAVLVAWEGNGPIELQTIH